MRGGKGKGRFTLGFAWLNCSRVIDLRFFGFDAHETGKLEK